jgi:endonuclease/exonuclease/phosphatase family metal-dependent hydrolase
MQNKKFHRMLANRILTPMKTATALLSVVLFAAIARAGEIDVMSFNIRYGTANDAPNHWSARKERVFGVFKEHAPDAVGLQEALRFQIDEIRAAVPEYGEIGEGRDGGEAGEYSAVLYRRERFEVAESGTFWLSETPEKPSITWGNTCVRICTWARLIDRKSKESFYLYNTHLDHRSQPSREKSVRLIARRMNERKVKDDPVVLTGDFNAGEENSAIRYLKGVDAGGEKSPLPLVDSFRVLHPDERVVGTFNGFKRETGGAKIDYIFVSPAVKVVDAGIIRPPAGAPCPSDHYPVTTRIRISQ